MIVGMLLFVAGVLFTVGGRFGLGRLPGDFAMRSGNTRFFFPLATSILLSIGLTILINLYLRFFK